ncbi:MAG: type III-B CRISPR-associated protein Cas10/Cmr2, partial [Thermoplasmatales archaeon]
WKLKLLAFLHDPPDKALKIANHENRRDNLLSLIGIKYDDSVEYNKISDGADHVSSAMQRLNIPENCKIYIDFSHRDKPVFKHPLSAEIEKDYQKEIGDYIATYGYEGGFAKYQLNIELLKSLIDKLDLQKTYLAIWRNLPVKYPLGNFLPADTRIPDHSIYDHMDITSALAPCIKDGISFLSFKIGPVQEFIENARKTADLWSGSHILSYLSFSAIRAVAEECGPDAVIFPYLRGQPFVDFWLYDTYKIVSKPDEKHLQVSNIPHRFLAIVPKTKTGELSKKIEESVRKAWLDISERVLDRLQEKGIIDRDDEELRRNWDRQIHEAFNITTQSLDWANPPEDDSAVRRWFEKIKEVLPEDIIKKYNNWLAHYTNPNTGALYGLYFELISALIDQKSRFFEHAEEPGEAGGERCSLCGIRNSIRTKDKEPKQFWKEVQNKFPGIFREGERLCAVCTVKRLYKEINPFDVRRDVDSVATIAMREFLNKCKAIKEYDDFLNKFNEIIGSAIPSQRMEKDKPEGEWFYLETYNAESIKREYGITIDQNKIDELKKSLKNLYDKIGNPPKYYAILVMDGDEMGKKLRGEGVPPLRDFLHPTVLKKLNEAGYKEILESPRILNPNIHMAISRALLEFSINRVGSIIEDHKGLLVYSGGDDVLALLPAEKALDAAREINDEFGMGFYKVGDRHVMLLGKNSTMSAGIVFAHYKYPFYDALKKAREALKRAKEEYERKAFVLVDIRHSGQISTAGGNWEMTKDLEEFAKLMKIEKKDVRLSSRFIYHLLEDVDAIEKLDNEGKKAYLKYLLGRHLEIENGEMKKAKINAKINELSDKLLALVNIIENNINEKRKKKKKEPIPSLREISYLLKILTTIGEEGEE